MFAGENTKEEVKVKVISKTNKSSDLILYNDDFHTFDYVIKSLIRICGHSPEQAEQSAYIVHNNGECNVKQGPKTKLDPMCRALIELGLTAEVK